MSDLIDRQKVLNTLDFADNALTDEDRTVEKYKELLTECIKALPPAENNGEDRPKGHWIYWSNSPFRWECDKCGGLFKTDFNFCPNCGADMRGGE